MVDITTLDAYKGNPKTHSEMFLDEKADEVILLICKRGVAFTTEIARDTGINIDEVNKILSMFKRHKFIDKIYPNMEHPQPQFRGRLVELNAMGIINYEKIRNFSWWTLSLPGFSYIKAKFDGEHKPISGGLLKPLGLKIIEDDEDNDSLSNGEKELLGI